MEILFFALRLVVHMGIFGCTAHLFYMFFRHPEKISAANRRANRDLHWVEKTLWLIYVVAAACGTGICIYRIAVFGLAWIPYSWRAYDEDGASSWQGSSIAYSIAIFGVLGVFQGMISVADRISDAEERLRRLP